MPAPLEAGSPLPDLSPEAAITVFLRSLPRPTRLLVAISGGSDSTGLLLCLKRAVETQHFPHRHSLTAATIDHDLRPGSAEEAHKVADLCQRLDIPHRIARWTGAKPEHGISAAAREARYRMLAEAADALGAEAIVTGHTLDDQIETVTMRAHRSADGAVGLAGMAPATLYASRFWLLRPFLHVRRSAIRAYLTSRDQAWIDDPSNEDASYERIRVRLAAPTHDPAAIEQAARHREALSREAAHWLDKAARLLTGPVVKIALATDTFPHPEVRDHALSTLVAVLGGKPHRPGAASLARLTAALDTRHDFRLTLSGTLALRQSDELFLLRERRGLLPLSVPAGSCIVWDGRYMIRNNSGFDITVTSCASPEIDPALPGAVRAALAGNYPQVLVETPFSDTQADRVAVAPLLSLFANFMSSYDQPLADAIGVLIGTEPTPPAPI